MISDQSLLLSTNVLNDIYSRTLWGNTHDNSLSKMFCCSVPDDV